MWTESQGCAVLYQVFTRRGFVIATNVLFREGEGAAQVSFEIDGWDANERVGYEFLSRSEGDHDDLTPEELVLLGDRMTRGELAIFVVDETDFDSEAALEIYADAFLDEVMRRKARRSGPTAEAGA